MSATATNGQTDATPAAASTAVPTANTTSSTTTTTASNSTPGPGIAVFKDTTVAANGRIHHLSNNNTGRTAPNTTASASTSSTTSTTAATPASNSTPGPGIAVFRNVTVAARDRINHLSNNNNGRTAADAVLWQAIYSADFSGVTVGEGAQLNSGSHNGNVGDRYGPRPQAGNPNANGGGRADNQVSPADMVLDMLDRHFKGARS